MAKKFKFPSELRFDLMSNDWVVIATGRAKRPDMFKTKRKTVKVSKRNCPFCSLSEKEKPTLVMIKGKEIPMDNGVPKNWTTIVIPNKYPAFIPYPRLEPRNEGEFYKTINAVGFQEVLVTKSHTRHMALLPVQHIKEIISAYRLRYISLMNKDFVNHISIFHNHGSEAGASVVHPHSQIITTPLVDADVKKAFLNAKKYYQKNKQCAYCRMNKWEQKTKKRIIFENKEFLVICPFASKAAFQVIISPKKHSPHFEQITEQQREYLAEAFKVALYSIYKGLGDPAYNFYLHTAPADGKKYEYYHWHWTIIPKTSTWAGFEIGTEMEISTIEPEKAAEYLRKQ